MHDILPYKWWAVEDTRSCHPNSERRRAGRCCPRYEQASFTHPDTRVIRPVPILGRCQQDDRVVVVTGASTGLGIAMAPASAGTGSNVAAATPRVERRSSEERRFVDRRFVLSAGSCGG